MRRGTRCSRVGALLHGPAAADAALGVLHDIAKSGTAECTRVPRL